MFQEMIGALVTYNLLESLERAKASMVREVDEVYYFVPVEKVWKRRLRMKGHRLR